MRPEPRPPVRLNILALPTRTTLLFALIVLVVTLPILALFAGRSPMCAPFLLFWMVLLPLRDFLRRPGQLLGHHDMVDATDDFPVLTRRWNELAAAVVKQKVRLKLMRRRLTVPFSFGSFTRRYFALSARTATRLEHDLRSTEPPKCRRSEAMLLHELAHFIHHDAWMAFFSASLLRVTVALMLVDYAWYAMAPWLYNSVVSMIDFSQVWPPEFLQLMAFSDPKIAEALLHPPRVEGATWANWEVFVFSAHWPLILGSLILLLFYWRALLRTRELYADARVVEKQSGRGPLWAMLRAEQVANALQPVPGLGARNWIPDAVANLRGIHLPGERTVRGLLSHHPSLETRDKCLDKPHLVYGSDVIIGVTAGVAVVLLNLTLATSYLLLYTRGPNTQVPFLIGFSVLSLSLLPFLCQFPERKREYAAKIKKVVLIFTAIKLIPQYLVGIGFALALLLEPALLDRAAYTLVPGAGANPPPTGIPVEFAIEVFVIRPAILFTFAMPLVLIFWLHLDAWIKRQLMHWYRARWVRERPAWVFSSVTFLLMVLLALVVLPILDAGTIPTAHDLGDPATVLGMLFGSAMGLGAASAIYFANRRYADRCPVCDGRIAGEYTLGMACPTCGEVLHPKLIRQASLAISRPAISFTANATK